MTRDKVEKDIPQLLEDHKRFMSFGAPGVGSDFSGLDLRDYNLRGLDLWGATMRGVDMRGMDLTETRLAVADMREADLTDACLEQADLTNANLRDACLIRANLQGADMMGANLRNANLSHAVLDGACLTAACLTDATLPKDFRIASLCFGGYPVTVSPIATTIGCQRWLNETWLSFEIGDPRIEEMAPDAAEWWARHRESVCAVIRDVMQPLDTPEVSK